MHLNLPISLVGWSQAMVSISNSLLLSTQYYLFVVFLTAYPHPPNYFLLLTKLHSMLSFSQVEDDCLMIFSAVQFVVRH